ncbi:hypothetical protein EN829_000960 [Mesorhizobium sp. M00.F.Ca.ET.186.01.1.1]|nr:hypothetical protein EN848_09560 [bacterium M00.F.Ca.ET.205.01.1.1]TGU55793.1 hypothetical protein EN795_03465 [bacterium M00.F.Ca.ET.152.01.1.1]TGV39934.1 hypothetical protein EN829_000960 [Mesorhizobium sp. M00.F.Ca.ET.186.01.1.1]TGZ44916.1 hypothetical protein EN805_00955 [bacterium M00.F.Ca.ET.162.01.1.1]
MQSDNDGTHVILPSAAPIGSRPDRARLPATLLRQCGGKVRRDGSSAATLQPKHPVAERGGLLVASELDAKTRDRSLENKFVYYRGIEEKRRWKESLAKYDRLRRQDKASLRLRLALLGKLLSAHCFRLRKRSSFRPVRCVSDGGIADNTLVVLANPPCRRNVRSAVSTPQPVFARLSAMSV